jgi:hypothetical protein
VPELLHEGRRQRVEIDLEPELERALRAETGPHAAERFALDRVVQPELAAPERLVAERVEAERLPPLFDHPPGIARDREVSRGESRGSGGREDSEQSQREKGEHRDPSDARPVDTNPRFQSALSPDSRISTDMSGASAHPSTCRVDLASVSQVAPEEFVSSWLLASGYHVL